MDYGARQHDAQLGRFTTMDPMAEKYYNISPYAYCLNNPMRYVDPNGMDIWEIDREGRLVRKSESDTEELYFYDENGNRMETPVIIKNKNILEDLSNNGNANVHYSTTGVSDIEDIFKIFKGAADNTDVEWAVYMHNDDDGTKFTIGTNHNENVVGGYEKFGIKNKPVAKIHSHPKVKNNMAEERESMGHRMNDKGESLNLGGDFENVRRDIKKHGSNATISYVYMQNSGRVYHIHNYGTSFIRNARSSHKRFFWGVFNNEQYETSNYFTVGN